MHWSVAPGWPQVLFITLQLSLLENDSRALPRCTVFQSWAFPTTPPNVGSRKHCLGLDGKSPNALTATTTSHRLFPFSFFSAYVLDAVNWSRKSFFSVWPSKKQKWLLYGWFDQQSRQGTPFRLRKQCPLECASPITGLYIALTGPRRDTGECIMTRTFPHIYALVLLNSSNVDQGGPSPPAHHFPTSNL